MNQFFFSDDSGGLLVDVDELIASNNKTPDGKKQYVCNICETSVSTIYILHEHQKSSTVLKYTNATTVSVHLSTSET